MFSALRQGQLLYILVKGKDPSIEIGHVEGVTQPRPKYNTYNPTVGLSANMETLVDITVKIDNEKKEFLGVPSNLSSHEYGDVFITESRDAMISEIDGLLQSSKRIVETVDYHKKLVGIYEQILKELNPTYAKEQERDDAIESLKGQVSSIHQDISKIMLLLTKTETV